MEISNPIEYYKIDKISDDIYLIAANILLKFNVVLSNKSNGKRYHYYTEFEYDASSQGIEGSLVSIKRSFDAFLSIESVKKDQNGTKLFIRIGYPELPIIKQAFEEVLGWIDKPIYAQNDKKGLFVVSPYPSKTVRNLPLKKSITITPIVIEHGLSMSDRECGVRLDFGDGFYADISIDKLAGLTYILSSFNMYQSAQIMLNFIQRPEFGTNRIDVDTSTRSSKSTNSFFDKEVTVRGVNRVVNPKDRPGNMSILED